MRPCAICNEPTNGSVGAAGGRCPVLCQPCKDNEDQALLASVRNTAHALNLVTDVIDRALIPVTESETVA